MSDSQYNLICGVDEAGRGPLAGPVFAACVVLNSTYKIEGLSDSKKLSEKKRNALTHIIKKRSIAWAVASASVEEIDKFNILQASLLAMKRAVESLPFPPNKVLVDGIHSPQLNFPVQTIIKGDSLVPEISAASILAKTARDAEMLSLHKLFPNYGFDQHKGYPTKKHIAALQMYGISTVHRRSFSPVRKLILCNPI
ncbi:MAG: ribonuclease HII [Nitrosomonadales bacterium]|nr:MAG: ribonuclease HII [Nitrosomonadales bacterium]